MYHRRLRRKLGVKSNHRKALLRNLVRSLVIRRRIRTTLARAKEAGAMADQMITVAKRGDLHARRLLVQKLACPDTAHRLMTVIAPHFKERQGGYTRVLRLGTRKGDGGSMALLEFSVLIEEAKKPKKPKKEKKAKAAPDREEKQVSQKEEKAKKEKLKEKEEMPSPIPGEKEEAKKKEKEEKKESEKKGGFLSTLRKFLKGDDK